MKLLGFLILLFSTINLYSQIVDTLYFDKHEISEEDTYYLTIKNDDDKTYWVNEYFVSGKIKRTTKYYSKKKVVTKDNFLTLEKSKKIFPVDKYIEYYSSGKIKTIKYFDSKGKRNKEELFMQNGDTLYKYAEVMPQYPGGNEQFRKDIISNLNYPKNANYLNVSGTVFVKFVVDKNGQIQDVSILKSLHPLFDAEAIKAVKKITKKWKPGLHKNVHRNIIMQIPITFK